MPFAIAVLIAGVAFGLIGGLPATGHDRDGAGLAFYTQHPFWGLALLPLAGFAGAFCFYLIACLMKGESQNSQANFRLCLFFFVGLGLGGLATSIASSVGVIASDSSWPFRLLVSLDLVVASAIGIVASLPNGISVFGWHLRFKTITVRLIDRNRSNGNRPSRNRTIGVIGIAGIAVGMSIATIFPDAIAVVSGAAGRLTVALFSFLQIAAIPLFVYLAADKLPRSSLWLIRITMFFLTGVALGSAVGLGGWLLVGVNLREPILLGLCVSSNILAGVLSLWIMRTLPAYQVREM